jgi:crotonobetainyl-CoA:carnitine CoA-transferase CaiB-like acyl-CoA transferase
MDVQVASLANQSLNWLAGGVNPERLGSDHPNVVPAGAYATKTGYVVIVAGSALQFERLLRTVNRLEWQGDPRFSTNDARVQYRAELRSALESVLITQPAAYWLEAFRRAGVPCGLVRDVAEVFADADVSERLVRYVEHPRLGKLPQVLSPIRIDGEPLAIELPPPDLGADTSSVRDALAGGERAGGF